MNHLNYFIKRCAFCGKVFYTNAIDDKFDLLHEECFRDKFRNELKMNNQGKLLTHLHSTITKIHRLRILGYTILIYRGKIE